MDSAMGFYNGGKVLARHASTRNQNKNRTIIPGK